MKSRMKYSALSSTYVVVDRLSVSVSKAAINNLLVLTSAQKHYICNVKMQVLNRLQRANRGSTLNVLCGTAYILYTFKSKAEEVKVSCV